MKHRRGVQITGAWLVMEDGHRVQGIENQVPVAQHHALGTAGCAAGVEQAGQVFIAALCIGDWRGCLQDRLVTVHSGRWCVVTEIDDLLHVRNPAFQRFH